jgi:hypothetical protein
MEIIATYPALAGFFMGVAFGIAAAVLFIVAIRG